MKNIKTIEFFIHLLRYVLVAFAVVILIEYYIIYKHGEIYLLDNIFFKNEDDLGLKLVVFNKEYFYFYNQSVFSLVYNVLKITGLYVLCFLILKKVMFLIKSISENTFFSQKTTKQIVSGFWLLVVTQFLNSLVYFRMMPDDDWSKTIMFYDFNIFECIILTFLGVFVYTFKQAIAIKQENDLTI